MQERSGSEEFALSSLLRLSGDAEEARRWWRTRGGAEVDALLLHADVTGCDGPVEDGSELIGEEIEARHPGDSFEDEYPQPADPRTQMIVTVCRGAGSVVFCCAGEVLSSVRASYPGQIRVRVDPQRLCLIYDVVEAQPSPTATPDDLRHQFDSGRLCRFRVHLETVCGIQIVGSTPRLEKGTPVEYKPAAKPWQGGAVVEEDRKDGAYDLRIADGSVMKGWLPGNVRPAPGAAAPSMVGVLVLSLNSAPLPWSFAVREVGTGEGFVPVGDWTPDCGASGATRHYIVGGYSDLVGIAKYLSSIDPRIAALLTTELPNALSPPPNPETPPAVAKQVHARAILRAVLVKSTPRFRKELEIWPCSRPAPDEWGPVDVPEEDLGEVRNAGLGNGKFALFGDPTMDPGDDSESGDERPEWEAPSGIPTREYDPQFDPAPSDDFNFPLPEGQDEVLAKADEWLGNSRETGGDAMEMVLSALARGRQSLARTDPQPQPEQVPQAGGGSRSPPNAAAPTRGEAGEAKADGEEKQKQPSVRELERVALSRYAQYKSPFSRTDAPPPVPDSWEDES